MKKRTRPARVKLPEITPLTIRAIVGYLENNGVTAPWPNDVDPLDANDLMWVIAPEAMQELRDMIRADDGRGLENRVWWKLAEVLVTALRLLMAPTLKIKILGMCDEQTRRTRWHGKSQARHLRA